MGFICIHAYGSSLVSECNDSLSLYDSSWLWSDRGRVNLGSMDTYYYTATGRVAEIFFLSEDVISAETHPP